MKIGYSMCGSCNPKISTGALLRRLKAADRSNEYVFFEEGGYEKLLLISGCASDCTTRPPGDCETIVVAGDSINNVTVGIDNLLDALLEMLSPKE